MSHLAAAPEPEQGPDESAVDDNAEPARDDCDQQAEGDAVGEWDVWADAGEPADTAHDTQRASGPGAVDDVNGDAGEETDELCYATVEEFVTQFLAKVGWVNLETSGRTWCPEWWRHPAAIVRLEALHRSFEELRQDPGLGMSTWLRDHLDRHMAVLTDEADGPFKGCKPDRGHDAVRDRTLPCAPAPESLFEAGD